MWGPIRHVVGHNIAAYHRNADDIRVELFCELDMMLDETLGYFEPRPWHEDRPQCPKGMAGGYLAGAMGVRLIRTVSGLSLRSRRILSVVLPQYSGKYVVKIISVCDNTV